MIGFVRTLIYGTRVVDLCPLLFEVGEAERNAERRGLYLMRKGRHLATSPEKGVVLAEQGDRTRRGERLRQALAPRWARQWPQHELAFMRRLRQQQGAASNVLRLRAGGHA